MTSVLKPVTARKEIKVNLNHCLLSISQLVDLDVIELWTRGQNGLMLHHKYKADPISTSNVRSICNSYESKDLCEMSLASPNGFHSEDSADTLLVEVHFMSAVAFHLPRDNSNTDIFIVGYSMSFNTMTSSKLNLMYWLGHAACAVAFAPDFFESDAYKASLLASPKRIQAIRALQSLQSSSSMLSTEETDGIEKIADASSLAHTIVFSKEIHAPMEPSGTPRLDLSTSSTNCLSDITVAVKAEEREIRESDIPTLKLLKEDRGGSSPSMKPLKRNSQSNGDSKRDMFPQSSNMSVGGGSVITTDSAYYDKGRDSDCSSVGAQTMGSALTSVTGIGKLKPMRSIRSLKGFDFSIIDLPLLRNINRRVDLNEMVSLEYVTGGSHSQVYSAMWNNQSVVVKILSEQKANHTVAIHEFDVECELLARLNHENIASILGGGVIPRPFIIMERLRDVSGILNLASQEGNPVMFKNKVFKFNEALQLSKDLAVALSYLHTHCHPDAMILHRDLKPENLGLDPRGKLKLFDFGLCRCVLKRSSDTQSYEMTGNTGSLRYMAPEVVLGKPYTEKVDVYSFAMIMWTFASSKSPFKGFDRAMHRARVVVNGERPKLDSDWPIEFTNLLEACWSQDDMIRPNFTDVVIQLDGMIDSFNRDPGSVKTKTKGLSFLKTIFTKR